MGVITVLIVFTLVNSCLFLVLLVGHEFSPKTSWETPIRTDLKVGDGVVYRKQKVSARPGPRAYGIRPNGQEGEDYCYFVDKFWKVENVLRDGRIVVTTRTQKRHYLQPDDPNLRKAGLIIRLRFRNRFPELPLAA